MAKFFSDLHINPRLNNLRHLIHFKIHGGVSNDNIKSKVVDAERLSRENYRRMYADTNPTG
jgi:hypothetical protein